MKRSQPTPRTRRSNDDEIRALWNLTGDLGCYGAIIRMLLLTAQRREKVARMKWTDLSSDGVWAIATEPRAKGNPGILILPKPALEIIAARPRVLRNPCVFAAVNGPGPFNTWSAEQPALDLKLEIAPRVLHGLRRTARSLMSRAGVQSEHAERVLGHSVGTAVEEVYDRREYLHQFRIIPFMASKPMDDDSRYRRSEALRRRSLADKLPEAVIKAEGQH